MFKQTLHVPENIAKHLNGDAFEACMRLQGKAFRDVPGRKTMQITLAGKSYFIKQHFGVGWAEIVKNLVSFKWPILGAMTEVAAIEKCTSIGIATTPLVAYGQRGCNPATLQSFVLTEDLGDIVSLEDLCADWQENPPKAELKQTVIIELAKLAAKLHGAGQGLANVHRDFYLCHFVLKKSDLNGGNFNLHIIDLHRMLLGRKANSSAVMKDMAGLYFSMLQIGLTSADFSVIKQHYLPQTDAFWAKAEVRAQQLLAKFNSQKFQARLAKEKSSIG